MGKAAKPMCGVVNDCRTVASMKALMVPHFRHIGPISQVGLNRGLL